MYLPIFCEPRDLEHAVDDPVVEADVVDQRARARRRADAVDARAVALQLRKQREQSSFERDDALPEVGDPALVREAALLAPRRGASSTLVRLRASPGLRGVDANRAAVRRDPLDVDDLEAVLVEQADRLVSE